jgi:hypothetical protein
MRKQGALLVGLVALILAAAPGARADVTVLGLRSLDGDEALAEKLTQFLRDFVGTRGVATVAGQTQTLEQMLLLGDCGDDVDARCMREIADMLGADEVLYGFVTRMPGDGDRFTYSIDVRRFSSATHRDVETAGGTLEPTRQGTANLQILANTLIDDLWGRTSPTTLIVQSNEPNAEVFVDDRAVGRTGSEPLWIGDVTSGEHSVRIVKDGFDEWSRTVSLEENQYRLLEAPLNEVAAAAVEPPPEVVPEVPPVEPEPEGPGYFDDWHNIAGWASVGGGVAFLVTGIALTASVSGLNDDGRFAEYRANTPEGQDACDRADGDPDASYIRDVCDSGSTYEIVQFVMYGLAAVAAGTGAYFLLTADGDEAQPEDDADTASVSFAPIGLPGGGGLGISGRF